MVSFLITGMVSFAEGNTKEADKKAEVKNINGEEYIINEELLKNILRQISIGNIHIIGEKESAGRQEINGGLGINNGTLTGGGMWGDWAQDINGGLGINNGIIINKNAYGGGAFYKNGISLKRENGKLVINTGSDYDGNVYNNNVNILGKNELTTSSKLSEVITNNKIEQKNVGQEIINGQTQEVKGYNLFINNLGNETNDKDNQLIIDTDLSENFANTHITTAVTENGYTKNEAVIKIADGLDNFSMDKSTIIGYFEKDGTLVNMNGAKTVELNDSVISAFGKDDTIKADAIKFAEGSTVTLNNSTVNGKMNFSAGNNILNLNGKYNGTNHDTYKDGTQYGTYVSDVEFGAGNDTAAFKSKITADTIGKGAENIVLLNNFLFNKIKGGTLENLQLADGGNTFYFEGNGVELDFNGKVLGGNGDDKFIVSADKLSGITIDGGADNTNEVNGDTLELTTEVNNTTTGNPNLFDNVINVENLHLANVSGNKLDINNIVTADGNIKFKNYVGGDKDDSFTVSIENFEKLSLIDGGGNVTAGDTLKIDGFEITNIIKNDENIPVGVDKTFFGKIKNIENLELNSTLGINLDLDGSESGALQNLNINLGSGMLGSEVSTSISKLNELKSLTGGTKRDTLIIKDVIAENETFDFMKKEDGTSKISSVEKIKFSDKNDTINLNNFDSINSGVEKIYGESGNDKFIVSSGRLNNFKDISGGDGEDFIEITDSVKNSQVLENVFVENLILKGNGNEILVDDLVEVGATSIDRTRFTEITVSNDGTVGDTFTINGDKDDTERNNVILGMVIGGGSSTNDTLKVNTGILTDQLSNKTGIENLELGLNPVNLIDYTIDFTKLKDFKNIKSGNGSDHFTVSADNIGSMKIDGGGTVVGNNGNLISKDHDKLILSGILNNDTEKNKDILKEVKNIEDLELDNGENILNLNNIKLGTEENGFKNIYGGNGNDTFKISAENLGKIDILKGEIQQGTNDNDRLEITSGNIDETNTNLLNKVSGVENLILAENSSNNIDLDNLIFKNITAKNGNDTFIISADNLGNFNITGGDGEDTLEIKTILTNNADLVNYKGFETLKFDASGNNVALTKENADGDSFKNIIFADNYANNTISIDKELGAKNITFNTFDETNKVLINETADANLVKTFKHTIKNAGEIRLNQGNFEWKFVKDTINNTSANDITKIDLGTNTLNLLNNEGNIYDYDNIPTDKIVNSGNIGLENGNLVFGDLDFVANGKVEVTNGEIKIGFDSSVKFSNGANTKFTLNEGKEIAFGTGVTFTSPYEFIKIDGTNISVKQWNEYKGYNSDFSLYAGRYDEILKKYNGTDKDSIAVTNALNGFSEENIFKFVTDKQGDKLVYYSDEDSTPYDTKVIGEDILIKTNPDTAEDQDMNLTFKIFLHLEILKLKLQGEKITQLLLVMLKMTAKVLFLLILLTVQAQKKI